MIWLRGNMKRQEKFESCHHTCSTEFISTLWDTKWLNRKQIATLHLVIHAPATNLAFWVAVGIYSIQFHLVSIPFYGNDCSFQMGKAIFEHRNGPVVLLLNHCSASSVHPLGHVLNEV